jgi:NitT/TauT family transport system permease protein
MIASTTMLNKKDFSNKLIKAFIALIFWVAVWEITSIFIGEDLRLFLPSPFAVLRRWSQILLEPEYLKATAFTLLRIITGFCLGAATGIFLAILTNLSKLAYILLSPALKIIRAVPVVSFIILAFLFMSTDTLPLFISFLMVVPLVWQASHDGIENADKKLCEMGKVFGFNKIKILFKIRFPLSISQILSSLVSGLGYAWKSGVAAEVICTPEKSLGHEIFRGKFNLDYESVYAVTLTVVLLSLVIEILFKTVSERYIKGGCLS